MNYKCTSTGGGGTDSDEGIWTVNRTAKIIAFSRIPDDWFDPMNFRVRTEVNMRDGNIRYSGFGNVVIDWEDGTYTAYPNQAGTPYYFEPIVEPVRSVSKPIQESLFG